MGPEYRILYAHYTSRLDRNPRAHGTVAWMISRQAKSSLPGPSARALAAAGSFASDFVNDRFKQGFVLELQNSSTKYMASWSGRHYHILFRSELQ